jgi:hypothetical protein
VFFINGPEQYAKPHARKTCFIIRQYPPHLLFSKKSIWSSVDEKILLRKRIATLVSYGDLGSSNCSAGKCLPTEYDVFLYPTGMSAIWHAHQLTLSCKPGLKSVCFGYVRVARRARLVLIS